MVYLLGRTWLLTATVAIAFGILAPATANVSSIGDPDDVHGPLDIRRIVHGHGNNGVLWHKLVMWNRWGANDLRGTDEIRFFFSTDGEDRYDEVHASVVREDGKLAASIYEYVESGDGAGVGQAHRIRFTRPNRRSVKIFFDAKWVMNHRDRYAWSAGSSYEKADSKNCRHVCFDYSPRSNPDRLFHRL